MRDADVSGLEAYRDDAQYTAPEMEVHQDEDHREEGAPEQGVALASGFSIGVGGGAIAGELLVEDIERAA